MNRSSAQAIPTINGYIGQFRPVWSAAYRSVQENGKLKYFRCPFEAEAMAWRSLYAVEQSVMVRDGERVSAAKVEADSYFKRKRA